MHDSTSSPRAFNRRRFVQISAFGAVSLSSLLRWSEPVVGAASSRTLTSASPVLSGDFAALTDPVELQQCFDAAVSLGARVIRFPVDWGRVQRRPGSFDWSAYDALQRELIWGGFQAVPVLVNAPEWLPEGEIAATPSGLRYPTGDVALNLFGEFAAAVVAQFTRFGSTAAGIEVWSRPNGGPATLIADPRHLACMVDTVALTIPAILRSGRQIPDPVPVIAGSFAASHARDWQPYAEAVVAGPVPVYLSLDFSQPATPDRLLSEVQSQVGDLSAMTQAGVWVNAAVDRVAIEFGSEWEALNKLASCTTIAECRGLSLNPLCQSLQAVDESSFVNYPEASGILNESDSTTATYHAIEAAWHEG
jgi:hypothetical protein